jgi:hypothetical protein
MLARQAAPFGHASKADPHTPTNPEELGYMEAIIERDFSIFECHASKTSASTWAMDSEILSNMEVVETPYDQVPI